MNQPWVYMCPHPEPPCHLPPHPIPQGHPSAPALSTLSRTLNLDWRSVSHMIIYMFQCYSLRSSHPCLLPQSPKVCSLHLCLFCCLAYRNYCCCLVSKLCVTLCDPMGCSTTGFSIPHHLLEFAQVHVHWIGDAIQPSYPLSPNSPLVLSLSQHRGLFQ